MKKFKESKEKILKRTSVLLDQDLTDYLADISQNEIFNYSWQNLMREILLTAAKDEKFLESIFAQKVEKLKKALNNITE